MHSLVRSFAKVAILAGLIGGCEEQDAEFIDGGGIDAAALDASQARDSAPVLDSQVGPPACPANTLTAGDHTITMMHGGVERSYLLHVPASYNGTSRTPLVLELHGLYGTAEFQRSFSRWLEKSDQEGFLLVHPLGLGEPPPTDPSSTINRSWNAGYCCGPSAQKNVDDQGFLLGVVAKVKAEACVDEKRVYLTGLSNGGAMTHLLSCRAANVFAATAPIAMGNAVPMCQPSRPISVTMYRATGDTLVPYVRPDGGVYPGADEDLEKWKSLNGCTGEPETVHGICKRYTNCQGGVEVTACKVTTDPVTDVPNGGHLMSRVAERENAPVPDVVWETFKRQVLP